MDLLELLPARIASEPDQFIFYLYVHDFLRREIADFGIGLMQRLMAVLAIVGVSMATAWIMFQGFRIVTGQARDSMMLLVANAARVAFIFVVATSMSFGGIKLHAYLTDELPQAIHHAVTGKNTNPASEIDKNLAWMQVAMNSVDVLDVAGDEALSEQKTRTMMLVSLGTGAPAVVGGTLFLMYEIALALFIGLGPLFILCLIFDSTKPLFFSWAKYGISTMFSMAVMSAMLSIATDMVTRIAGAFWASSIVGGVVGVNLTEGLSGQAMQQGMVGLILTLLLITTPMMAASFFSGSLGNLQQVSAFSGGSFNAAGRPPGGPGYVPSPNLQTPALQRPPPSGQSTPTQGWEGLQPVQSTSQRSGNVDQIKNSRKPTHD